MRIWIRDPESFCGSATLTKSDNFFPFMLFFCSEILDKAALAEDNYEQMAYVAAFTLSAYRCLTLSVNKLLTFLSPRKILKTVMIFHNFSSLSLNSVKIHRKFSFALCHTKFYINEAGNLKHMDSNGIGSGHDPLPPCPYTWTMFLRRFHCVAWIMNHKLYGVKIQLLNLFTWGCKTSMHLDISYLLVPQNQSAHFLHQKIRDIFLHRIQRNYRKTNLVFKKTEKSKKCSILYIILFVQQVFGASQSF
jgi:hypothetical protein